MNYLNAGNISAKYLAEHNARMAAWRGGEVHLLVKEQESAVKAVRLERLVGSVGQGGKEEQKKKKTNCDKDNASRLSVGKGSNKGSSVDEEDEEEEEEVKLTEAEKRKIVFLTEPPRPWLSPFYNR